MVSFRQPNGLRTRPRLRKLQEVQAEIYRQLQLLLPDQIAYYDHLASEVSGSPLLRLEVLERHKYTTFFRLTYQFREKSRTRFSPDAHIRHYHDARLAEATSFSQDQGCTRTADPAWPPRQLLQLAWRQNRALDRWLDYLLCQGHSVETMVPVTGKRCEKVPLEAGSEA